MKVRGAEQRKRLPSIHDLASSKYFPYQWGHAAWAYIAGRYGDAVVQKLWLRAAASGNVEMAIESVLGITVTQLSSDWHDAIRGVIRSCADGCDPSEGAWPAGDQGRGPRHGSQRRAGAESGWPLDGVSFGPQHPIDRPVHHGHGDRSDYPKADEHSNRFPLLVHSVHPIDGRLGRIERTPRGRDGCGRAGDSGHLQCPHRQTRPRHSTSGPRRDSQSGMGAGRSRYRVHRNAQGTDGPVFYDLSTATLRPITNDAFADLHPAWSPDSRRIVFASDRFSSNLKSLQMGSLRLVMADVATGRLEPLPAFDNGKHISPQWSPDGQAVYFVADPDGIPNVFRLSLANHQIEQITAVGTGVSGITPIQSRAVGFDAHRTACIQRLRRRPLRHLHLERNRPGLPTKDVRQ